MQIAGLFPFTTEAFGRLYRNRSLTLALAKREITDKYTRQMLGSLWAIGHPLIHVCVYIFIFQVVLKQRIGGTVDMPLDFVAYLLSGLIPWLAVQESLGKGSTVITSNANLVKQVVFPLEVLPVKSVLSCFVTQAVGTLCLMIYVLVDHGTLPRTYALLPLLWICQATAMVGIVFGISALGVYVRDIKELVQVFAVVGMYLVPIVYLPDQVPETIRILLKFNPFSHMVWCYQDACYYGEFRHPNAWIVFPLGSVLTFLLGYRLFRKLQTHFGSVL
ncbi:MAG TPA: ABC transporter permease [Gemmataceae bacterium]|jgi:lipopolysaccharide transport system permease protein|nr:ABC transporter permease [Gemmataceae bacterium]